jgi:hypothetical protein
VYEAISQMKNIKALGQNMFLVEFYHKFWEVLKGTWGYVSWVTTMGGAFVSTEFWWHHPFAHKRINSTVLPIYLNASFKIFTHKVGTKRIPGILKLAYNRNLKWSS